jgi:hypothetical protein
MTKEIIGSLLFLAFDLLASDYDATICKRFLLGKGMGLIIPTSLGEFGEDVFTTSISFGYHNSNNSLTLLLFFLEIFPLQGFFSIRSCSPFFPSRRARAIYHQ